MRLDKDYLLEFELWPHFEMRQGIGDVSIIAPAAPAAPSSVPSATAPESLSPNRSVRAQPAQNDHAMIPRSLPADQTPQSNVADVVATDPARSGRINVLAWPDLNRDASTCKACTLCEQRQQVVFGVGPPTSAWMFVGEAPGADEDQSGEPFVGPSGQLLDAMLQAAGLQRGRDVYITNVVKCRPSGNRAPTVEEIAACAPYLDRQIDLLAPKIIVALGKAAIHRLTGLDTVMADIRGQVYEYRGIPVVATYHPSYLLHKLAEKLKSWEDLVLAKTTFDRVDKAGK